MTQDLIYAVTWPVIYETTWQHDTQKEKTLLPSSSSSSSSSMCSEKVDAHLFVHGQRKKGDLLAQFIEMVHHFLYWVIQQHFKWVSPGCGPSVWSEGKRKWGQLANDFLSTLTMKSHRKYICSREEQCCRLRLGLDFRNIKAFIPIMNYSTFMDLLI